MKKIIKNKRGDYEQESKGIEVKVAKGNISGGDLEKRLKR